MCILRQGRGRKPKLTEADIRHLKILVIEDRRMTAADHLGEIIDSRSWSEKVSKIIISRQLMEKGLKRIAADNV